MTTESNGRLKINPVWIWTIGTYLLSVGLGLGVAIAQLSAARTELAEIRERLYSGVRSRSEGDAIIQRLDSQLGELEMRTVENRNRIIEIERRLR